VLVRHHDEPDHILRDEIQFGDLRATFFGLAGPVMILLDEKHYWTQSLGHSVVETIELSDLETTGQW
jgi:hypothetical protein